jgi:hypothetical protein
MKTIQYIATIAMLALGQSAFSASSTNGTMPHWLVGFWVQTIDEDGKPRDDTLEFKSDGTIVNYGPTCERAPAGEIHIYRGNVYATYVARKGIISIVLVPSKDQKHLTMTSVRTGNNAVYEPSPIAACIPAKG